MLALAEIMDVHSLQESRFRAAVRRLPPALDAVIARAKAAEADEDADADAPGDLVQATGSSGRPADWLLGGGGQQQGARERAGLKPIEEKAQIVGDDRSISFGASKALFHGGRQYRSYPHDDDPNRLRVLMGAEHRAAALNRELRSAREAKYDADVHAMMRLEEVCETALERQADGARLRLGRIATPDQWSFSGELRRRNHMGTTQWTAGFYVLCDGVLHEFAGRALAAPIVNAWPVLGGTCRRGVASSQTYPYVLELHVHRTYVDAGTEVLARVELAAPSREQRTEWVDAVERASLHVSRAFRNPANGGRREIDDDLYETGRVATPGEPRHSSRRRRRPWDALTRREVSPRRARSKSPKGRRKGGAVGRGGHGVGSPRTPRSARERLGGLFFRRGGGSQQDTLDPPAPPPVGAGSSHPSHDVRAGRRLRRDRHGGQQFV